MTAGRRLRRLPGAETWPDFHLDATAFETEIARLAPCTPADVARTFYRMYASGFGKVRWGDKTPTYGTELDQIPGLLPEAHILHISRDGRDVMLSVRGLWFRPGDTVEACAEDWARRLTRTREIGHRLSRNVEVRYEALVTSPEATLETICGFLDLTFEPAMLRYHERAGSRLDEHEARDAADGRLVISKAERRHNQRFVMKPPQPDRIGRWRQEATTGELRRFEAVAASGSIVWDTSEVHDACGRVWHHARASSTMSDPAHQLLDANAGGSSSLLIPVTNVARITSRKEACMSVRCRHDGQLRIERYASRRRFARRARARGRPPRAGVRIQ